MVFRRADGKAVERVHPLRQVMWHLMPERSHSTVFFEQQVEVGAAEALAERLSSEGPHRVTLFHVVLGAAARVLHEHPRMNRFVAGRKLYQRNEVEIAFSLKQSRDERAPILAAKRTFPPSEPLPDMVKAIQGLVERGRGGRTSASSDLEVRLAARLPRLVVAGAVGAIRGLDALGLLPRSYLRGDPLFASLFVANLGSLGMEAAFHHLYEYGNIPIFLTIGRAAPRPVVVRGEVAVRPVMMLRYTFDERIEDGFSAARALGALQGYIEAPETLLA